MKLPAASSGVPKVIPPPHKFALKGTTPSRFASHPSSPRRGVLSSSPAKGRCLSLLRRRGISSCENRPKMACTIYYSSPQAAGYLPKSNEMNRGWNKNGLPPSHRHQQSEDGGAKLDPILVRATFRSDVTPVASLRNRSRRSDNHVAFPPSPTRRMGHPPSPSKHGCLLKKQGKLD